MSVGRPGTLLPLPPISRYKWLFTLNKLNAATVISYVDRSYQTVFLQDKENIAALSCIIRGQQVASNSALLP